MNHTIENPKGIDVPIQKMQTFLHDGLTWGNIEVYGRVYKNPHRTKGLMPKAFVRKREYKDILTNDSKTAMIFFVDHDEHKTEEGIKFSNMLKIIFMVDLEKAYPSIQHRADSEAEIEALKLLRNKMGSFRLEKIDKGLKTAMSDFNMQELDKLDLQPYHVFALTGELSYQISCFN